MIRSKKGITLIALVITVIVLLILSGISLSLTLGENGILTKAREAKIQNEIGEEKEIILFAANAAKMKNKNNLLQYKELNEELEDKNVTLTKKGKHFKIRFNKSKRLYVLKGDGEVELYEELDPKKYGTLYSKLDGDGTLYIRSSENAGYEKNQNGRWNSEDIKKVVIEEKIAPTTSFRMFYDCKNLEKIENIYNFHTENVIYMVDMFKGCKKLVNLDVSKFDTSKVTNMSGMFSGCSVVNELDVSGFDTSKVTDIHNMFYECTNLTKIDISGFETNIVTDMNNMFNGCKKVSALNVSGFDTSKVTDMRGMFMYCNSVQELDVSAFDTSKVTNMSCMFYECGLVKKLDVKAFDTENVTKMDCMFHGCKTLSTLDLSGFDTNKVVNMGWMFSSCSKLEKLILGSSFLINENTNCGDMFRGRLNTLRIVATQDTADKLKSYSGLQNTNFEIID